MIIEKLKTISAICLIIGGIITLGFGVWHFTIPYQYDWISYLDTHPEELKRAVLATNFIMCVSLILLGAFSILVPILFKNNSLLNLVWPLLMVILWTLRVAYQIYDPQGTIIGVDKFMLAAFIISDLIFIFPLVLHAVIRRNQY